MQQDRRQFNLLTPTKSDEETDVNVTESDKSPSFQFTNLHIALGTFEKLKEAPCFVTGKFRSSGKISPAMETRYLFAHRIFRWRTREQVPARFPFIGAEITRGTSNMIVVVTHEAGHFGKYFQRWVGVLKFIPTHLRGN